MKGRSQGSVEDDGYKKYGRPRTTPMVTGSYLPKFTSFLPLGTLVIVIAAVKSNGLTYVR